jgi:hypothetical protein
MPNGDDVECKDQGDKAENPWHPCLDDSKLAAKLWLKVLQPDCMFAMKRA